MGLVTHYFYASIMVVLWHDLKKLVCNGHDFSQMLYGHVFLRAGLMNMI